MKRTFVIGVALFALLTLLYVLFESRGWFTGEAIAAWLSNLRESPVGIIGVSTGVGILLVADIVLPVPSSVVMTVSGMLLGVWLGALASFGGAMAAALTAFYICRLGGTGVFERIVGNAEIVRVTRWFERYGVFAIVLSRPVPMLTEVLSCLAGLSRMHPVVFVAAAALGALPISLVYAVAGSHGSLGNPWPAAVAALGIPAVGWALVRYFSRSRKGRRERVCTVDEMGEGC
ncbi:MAG: TVP38/TMEM64 family protein [Chloroflexota bacterium]